MAKKILAEEGYPNGFELKFANTALPGTQFMVDIGTAIADMWTKIGVKRDDQALRVGRISADAARAIRRSSRAGPRMYRTAGRPDAPWRYNAAFAPESTERLFGDKENCPETCQKFVGDLQEAARRARSREANRAERRHGGAGRG